MPINKAARYRFEILDECLRSPKKRWSKSELLRYVNRRLEACQGVETSISPSQLRYDLAAMESEYNAPIEMYRDGRSCYYRYEDPEFSIKSIPVEAEDLEKLNDAVLLLRQIKGFSIADDMAAIVKRLESRYKYTNTREASIISFESAPKMQGVENLGDIYQAILRQNVLKIAYQTFRAEQPRDWIIHPYMLKEWDHRWYLLGYVEEKKNHGVFALDRMKEIRVVHETFIENSFIDSEDYFSDVIGVTLAADHQVEELELVFSPLLAPYARTRPMHHSQRILQQYEDGSLHIALNLAINPELTRMLLSYGKDVKVIRPLALAAQIRELAEQISAQYGV
jgi:predicted DNA-binding transcriptional regulator YafY